MKTFFKFFTALFALFMILSFNAISALDHGASGPRFIVSQNPLAGRARGSIMNMVATTWKGLNILKGKPLEVANPKTTKQTDQRTKFTAVQQFSSAFLSLIQVGFKDLAIHKSEFNAAISYNIRNAIEGSSPDFTLDVSEARISQGNLLQVTFDNLASTVAGQLSISWTTNEGEGNSLATDQLMVAVSSDLSSKVKTIINPATKENEEVHIDLGSSWEDLTVDVWAYFVSADGEIVSTSQYLGQTGILAT